jgi:membrane-bound lytic murein transglycosylase B
LLVAALGLAAGAAVASLFPPTELERRTLGAAGESVREAAHRAGGTLSEAATQAAQHLKDEAASRGITPDGLKQMAREASNTFTTSVTEGTEQRAPKVTEGTEQRTPNRRTGMSGPE